MTSEANAALNPAVAAGTSVRAAVAMLSRLFTAAGIDSSAIDARRLVSAATGGDGGDHLRQPDRALTVLEATALSNYVVRRLEREPVSRVVGERGFYGRMFRVTPATLDPRPCSETLIDAALDLLDQEGSRATPLRFLDAGTGTGCLLLTLLSELPVATGVGLDISPDALAVAKDNARRLGVAERAEFVHGSFAGGLRGTFDMLICNPPYIPSGDISSLDRDVRDFDPLLALDGGPDGLAAYRQVASVATQLVPDGWILVEVGAGQASDVGEIFSVAMPVASNRAREFKDLGGHTRCVAVRTRQLP